MAELNSAQRQALWAALMEELSNAREPIAISKSELRAAVDAIDTWLNNNAAALNSAIPQPARGSLTTSQKARLLMFVVRARYVEGV
jgi:hypothetical protein